MSFQSLHYGCIVIILVNFPASRCTVFLFDALLIALCADDLEKYLIVEQGRWAGIEGWVKYANAVDSTVISDGCSKGSKAQLSRSHQIHFFHGAWAQRGTEEQERFPREGLWHSKDLGKVGCLHCFRKAC